MRIAAAAAVVAALTSCSGARAPEADTTRSAALPERLFVLPLEDRSGASDPDLAPRMTELLVAQLRLVSLSTLGPRDAVPVFEEMGAPIPARFDAAALSRFCEATGTEAIVSGVITEYSKGKAWSDDRLALSVRVIDAKSGRTIRGTSFVSDGPRRDASARGLDQLSLYGVQVVARELTRAGR
jgi:hypothetical protein